MNVLIVHFIFAIIDCAILLILSRLISRRSSLKSVASIALVVYMLLFSILHFFVPTEHYDIYVMFLTAFITYLITRLFPFRKQAITVTKKGRVKVSLFGKRLFRWRKYYIADLQSVEVTAPLYEKTMPSLYEGTIAVVTYNCAIMLNQTIVEDAFKKIDYSTIPTETKVDFRTVIQDEVNTLVAEAVAKRRAEEKDGYENNPMQFMLIFLGTMSADRNYAYIEEALKVHFKQAEPIIAFASCEETSKKKEEEKKN